MSRRRNRKRKLARKARNRKADDELLEPISGAAPRIRRSFFAKARKGDALGIGFAFSGIPVHYDPDDPTENLAEKTEAQKALWETLPDTVQ